MTDPALTATGVDSGGTGGPSVFVVSDAPRLALARRARPTGAQWEAALADSDRRSTERARHDLAAVVDPLDAVLGAGWEDRPFPVRFTGDLLGGDDPREVLDRLLTEQDLPPVRWMATRDGRPVGLAGTVEPTGVGYGLVRPAAHVLGQHVGDGGGAHLAAVELHVPALARHVELWERVLGTWCHADLVLAGAGGWRSEPDTAGRLVIGLLGDARLTTAPSSGGLPSSEELGQMDASFVPPGREVVLGATTPWCAAVLVTLNRPTAAQLAAAATTEAVYWPLLRADVPTDLSEPVTSYERALISEPGGVSDALAATMDAEALERVVARHLSNLLPRPTAGLQRSLALFASADVDAIHVAVRSALAGGVHVLPWEAPDRPAVLAGGRRVEADPAALLAMARLVDGDLHAAAELADLGPAEWAIRVVRELVVLGLLEVAG